MFFYSVAKDSNIPIFRDFENAFFRLTYKPQLYSYEKKLYINSVIIFYYCFFTG